MDFNKFIFNACKSFSKTGLKYAKKNGNDELAEKWQNYRDKWDMD